jgi:hypothetical protein
MALDSSGVAVWTKRSISFSLFYVMMNVGILLGNLVFDYVRKGLGEHAGFTVPMLAATRVSAARPPLETLTFSAEYCEGIPRR